jgi:hypothetical protein
MIEIIEHIHKTVEPPKYHTWFKPIPSILQLVNNYRTTRIQIKACEENIEILHLDHGTIPGMIANNGEGSFFKLPLADPQLFTNIKEHLEETVESYDKIK